MTASRHEQSFAFEIESGGVGLRNFDLPGCGRAQSGVTPDISPIRLGFLGTFENMRSDAAFLQRFAELDTQEA
jgi:hypothetical protein